MIDIVETLGSERFIWDVIFNPPTLFHNETLKGTHALFTFGHRIIHFMIHDL